MIVLLSMKTMKVITKMSHHRLVKHDFAVSSLRAAREAEGLRAGMARLRAEAGGLHRGINLPTIRTLRTYTKARRTSPSGFETFLVNSLGSAASDGIGSLLDGEGLGGAARAFGASLLDSVEQRSSSWLDRILRGQRIR